MKYFFLFFSGGLYLSACQSLNSTKNISHKPHPIPPSGFVQERLLQITKQGVNRFPHLSKDNQYMLFVSSERSKHQHSQVYMLDLSTQQEKRITFQDGQLINPQFIDNSQQIVYESTTDEDKEFPYLVRKYSTSKLQPPLSNNTVDLLRPILPIEGFEIYKSDREGYSIERLTNSLHFDGTSSILNKNELLISSLNHDQIDVYKLVKRRNKWQRIQISNSPHHEIQAQEHKTTKKMAWVELQKDFLYSNIVIGDLRGKGTIRIDEGIHYSLAPQWHPDGDFVLFTSNMAEYDNYELFVYDLKERCIKRLTYFSTMELDPIFSPDGKYIYFSSNLQGTHQIFRTAFHPPKSCTTLTSSAKMEP